MAQQNRCRLKGRQALQVRTGRFFSMLETNSYYFCRATETVERVKAYILADPDILDDKTKFVEGWGWDHTKWLLEEWPNYVWLTSESASIDTDGTDLSTARARGGSDRSRAASSAAEQRRARSLGLLSGTEIDRTSSRGGGGRRDRARLLREAHRCVYFGRTRFFELLPVTDPIETLMGSLRRRNGSLIPIRGVPGQRAGPRRPPRAHVQAAPKALRGHGQGRAPAGPDVGPRRGLQPHLARVFPPVGHMSMSGASSRRSLNECSCHAPEEKRNPANSR